MGIGWQALLDELGVDISRAEIIILQDALMERNGGFYTCHLEFLESPLHESIQGIDEAAGEARRLGVSFLPGIEISVEYYERRLHILALGFDAGHPAFLELYKRIRSVKEAKIPDLIAGIRERGIEISEDVVRLHGLAGIPAEA